MTPSIPSSISNTLFSRMTITLLLWALAALPGCINEDYPYFIKEHKSCIGPDYPERRALVLAGSGSNEEAALAQAGVSEYLTAIGISNEMLPVAASITKDYLDENYITQVWIMSGGAKTITTETITALYEFALRGGGLIITTDNPPYYADAEELAGKFGVTIVPSIILDWIGLLSKSDGTLKNHCITRDLEQIQGGHSPTAIVYPEDNHNFHLIGRKYDENYFVVFNDGKSRVFFDSAWTRYYTLPPPTDPDIKKLVQNITDYIECRCD